MTILTREEVIESILKTMNDMLETFPSERRANVCAAMLNLIAGRPVVYAPEEETNK